MFVEFQEEINLQNRGFKVKIRPMSETEETLKQENEILKAIAELAATVKEFKEEFESFKKSGNTQFEAIRQGLVENAIRFDRFEAEFYKVRSDISNLKADVREIAENRHKELV